MALSFNGASDVINILNAGDSIGNNDNYTIYFWYRRNGNPASNEVPLEKRYPASSYPFRFTAVSGGGTITFEGSDGVGGFQGNLTGPVHDDLWHFIAARRSGSSWVDMRNNMVSVISTAVGVNVNANASGATVYIGRAAGTAQFFAGSLSQIAIVKRTMSVDELTQVMATRITPDSQYDCLFPLSDLQAQDISGNFFNVTRTGTSNADDPPFSNGGVAQ